MKTVSKIVVVSLCIVLMFVVCKMIQGVRAPIVSDLREASLYSTDEWTTVSINDRYIKRRCDITNYVGSDGAILVQVIDENGKVLVEPQLLEVGYGKLLTTEWDISSNMHIVQIKSLEKEFKYKLGIMHSLSRSRWG